MGQGQTSSFLAAQPRNQLTLSDYTAEGDEIMETSTLVILNAIEHLDVCSLIMIHREIGEDLVEKHMTGEIPLDLKALGLEGIHREMEERMEKKNVEKERHMALLQEQKKNLLLHLKEKISKNKKDNQNYNKEIRAMGSDGTIILLRGDESLPVSLSPSPSPPTASSVENKQEQ